MNTTKTRTMKQVISCVVMSLHLAGTANAHPNASDASALSMLPVAVSVAAPVVLVSGAAMLTVVAVQAAANGTVWVLERGSDGARFSITLGGAAMAGLSVAAGTVVVVTVVGSGWLLSTAGKVIAFVPNEIGRALVYNERIAR
jgi:hypothetical protein